MTTPTLSAILIGQWQASPRLRGIVVDVLQPIIDDAIAARDAIQLMQHIDHAVGVWLDYLGTRLGIERPATTDPAQDDRFGFDMAGSPFDQAPFRGDVANDALYPLPDALYRRLVKARAIMVLGDGTIYTFSRAVREIDESAAVQDQRNMTVRVVTSRRRLLELADSIGALPRTAGVLIIYADRGRFGFDLAGVPFDQGAFTGV